MTRTASATAYHKAVSNGTPLQKEHFIYKKGDNPPDMVMRNGKWVNIREHNAQVMRQQQH